MHPAYRARTPRPQSASPARMVRPRPRSGINEAGAEPDAQGPSGASDLHGGGLREVGQSGHELRD